MLLQECGGVVGLLPRAGAGQARRTWTAGVASQVVCDQRELVGELLGELDEVAAASRRSWVISNGDPWPRSSQNATSR